MVRKILAWFGYVPRGEQSAMPDLWDARDFRPIWPRLVRSDAWKHDLEPWLRWALLQTFVALARERDAEQMRRLQVRADLLNEMLETPRLGLQREEAFLLNQRMTEPAHALRVDGAERATSDAR